MQVSKVVKSVVLAAVLIAAPVIASAATFSQTVNTGTVGASPRLGTFDFGTTFSVIDDVTIRFSGEGLGRNENVLFLLGSQEFNLGTEAASGGPVESPPLFRSLTLEEDTLIDLADGSIDFSVRVITINGATFAPLAFNTSLQLGFEGTEGPAITAVPIGPALPMALAGLGLLGWISRRKRRV